MRKLALTLIPLLLLACNEEPTSPASGPAPSFSATSEWQEVVLSVDWVLYNQCLDEDLHGTGTSFISAHAVTTPTETRTNSHARVADDWQLEGLTTHQIWLQVPGGHNEAVQTASGDFLFVEERFVFQNQTTGVVLDWPARITFVTSADGEVKVDRFVFDPCTLRH